MFGNIKSGTIRVSSKVLAHITEGIYRTVGEALKGLVSNSFDAGATEVRISTNYPEFDVVQCKDNGEGMLYEDFIGLVENKGIGESAKRNPDWEHPGKKYGRPIIGRLGIGLMAMAQLCRHFIIESHHSPSETAFRAEITFENHLLERIEKEREAKQLQALQKNDDTSKKTGNYKVRKIPYESNKHGMLITTRSLRPGLAKALKEDLWFTAEKMEKFPSAVKKYFIRRGDQYQLMIPKRFSEVVNLLENVESVRELGEYARLYYELSLMCPIEYLPQGPISDNAITALLRSHAIRENKPRSFVEAPKRFWQDSQQVVQTKNLIKKQRDKLSEYNFKRNRYNLTKLLQWLA